MVAAIRGTSRNGLPTYVAVPRKVAFGLAAYLGAAREAGQGVGRRTRNVVRIDHGVGVEPENRPAAEPARRDGAVQVEEPASLRQVPKGLLRRQGGGQRFNEGDG